MTSADPTRRRLLGGVVFALGGDQAWWFAWLDRRARALCGRLVRTAAAPAALSDSDVDDVVAFAEVVGGGALPAAERAIIVKHLQDRSRGDEGYYVELYRTTAQLLTRLAGAPFSTLDAAHRVALVTRERLAVAQVEPAERVGDDVRAVRTRAVPDLIRAYYASAAGWAVVGYRTFPGRCGELARYTRPEA